MVKPSTQDIWNEFSGEVLRYFEVRLHDRSVAQDLRQEVFVKVHEHVSEVRDASKLSHWMAVVMRNTLVNYWKKTNRSVPEELADSESGIPEAADHLARLCVTNMITRLPEKYATALSMADLEGYKQHEVAEALDLSLSGAKSRVQRGRDMLRDLIQECCKVEVNARNEIVDYSCAMENCSPTAQS